MMQKVLVLLLFVAISSAAYVVQVYSPDVTTVNIFRSAVALTVLYAVLNVGMKEIVVRRISDAKTRYNLHKTISLLTIVLVIAIWLRIWVADPQALLVAYGVLAAGLAIALQDLVKNFAGSIIIFVSGMYRVGNRIEVNGTFGDVIDIGLFNTTLLEMRGWIQADQATGRITTVPNGVVLSQPIQNFTKLHKYLWDELTVVVTAESNWQAVMQIMGEIGEEHTGEFIAAAEESLTKLERYYYVEGHVLKPNVYITPVDDGYGVTLRYVVDAWQRRSTNSEIWGHIIRVFDERDDIIIAPKSLAQMEYPLPAGS